jgi:hypothetical protein
MHHSTSAQTPKGMKENSLVRGQLFDRKKEKRKKTNNEKKKKKTKKKKVQLGL